MKIMRKSRVLALILAAAVAVSACAMLAGCGEDNKDNKDATSATAATTATTAATAATAAPAASQSGGNTATQAQSGDNSQGGNSANSAETIDPYLNEADAIANVRQQAGTGATIVSATKGYTPDGLAAWVIVVQPVTTENGAQTVTYYTNYAFCYAEGSSSSGEDVDPYMNESDAIANVRQIAGTGATIISTEKGYTPDGTPAWVIVVQPITTADGAETVTYYSNYALCYQAE